MTLVPWSFLRAVVMGGGIAIAWSGTASAHAFLDHAVPAVGATSATSPSDLDLTFTQAVVVALSGVSLSGPGGTVALPKPVAAGADTLRIHLSRPLKPGTYKVSWHVVSVDTHPTSGSYRFTVAP